MSLMRSLLVFAFSVFPRALASALCDALSPPSCAACDAAVPRGRVFCAACAGTVLRIEPSPEGVRAFATFGGAIASSLKRFKYEGRADLARPLGHLVRRLVRESLLSVELVVPVPLHPRRLASRGYNQAAPLARAAADELGVPFAPCVLARGRDTPQQAHLGGAARRANVAGAFSVRAPPSVAGRVVLLVDDVVTTGSTLMACRDALLAAGALEVEMLCLARAER